MQSFADGNCKTRATARNETPRTVAGCSMERHTAGSQQATEAPSAIPSYESIRHTAMAIMRLHNCDFEEWNLQPPVSGPGYKPVITSATFRVPYGFMGTSLSAGFFFAKASRLFRARP
jgi:hypothetical protein